MRGNSAREIELRGRVRDSEGLLGIDPSTTTGNVVVRYDPSVVDPQGVLQRLFPECDVRVSDEPSPSPGLKRLLTTGKVVKSAMSLARGRFLVPDLGLLWFVLELLVKDSR